MKIKQLKNTNQILLFLFLVIAGLYLGSSLFIPLTFAVFLATLVFPFVQFLEKRTSMKKGASSFIGTFVVFLGVGVLMFFFIQQLTLFLQDIIESRGQIVSYLEELQKRAMGISGLTVQQQDEFFQNSLVNIVNVTQTYVTDFLAQIGSLLFNFLLVLILIFLLLLNRDKFTLFLSMYTRKEQQQETKEIISQTRKVAHKYLWGRIQVMSILALMYFILFTAYDLRHTGLLIIFGALITIIPYIGPFISGVVPIIFLVMFGGSSMEILSFTIIITIIQLIESYVLEPVLIGSEVEQSPLFIILAIIIGGIIWGPAGLILFVPLFSILKILFDHTKGLKPVGFLVGYERPGSGEGIIEKIKRKLKK